jgi:hypothetical protein
MVGTRDEGVESAPCECAWTHLNAKTGVHEPLAGLTNCGNDGVVEEMGRAATESVAAAGRKGFRVMKESEVGRGWRHSESE